VSDPSAGEQYAIVCFGTSITQGVPHVPPEDTYPALLERRLNHRLADAGPKLRVINSGVSGHNTAEGLARIEPDVLAHEPDLVVIEFACNDVRYEPEKRIELHQFAANLKEMIARIREVGAEIIITTPSPIIDAYHEYSKEIDFYDPWGGCNAALDEYAEVVRQVAAQEEVTLCDIGRAFLERALEAEFEGHTADCSDLSCLAEYIRQADGVHLTVPGHRLMAAELYKIIAPRLLSHCSPA
jgi:lysophospholipase L1-like esterase